MPISRRKFLMACAGLALAAGPPLALAGRIHARPRLKLAGKNGRKLNTLMIVTDQERQGALLPLGLELPNHDRLYSRATRFSNMNAISGLCSIARGNIYTGQHYQYNGVYENVPVPFAHDLYADVATLGTMMQDAGYETAYFGKWHLTNLPPPDPGAERMRALFQSYGFDVSNQPGEVEGPHQGYAKDADTAAIAAAYVRSRKGAARPWFASVNLLNPHDIMFFLATRRQYETFVRLPFADIELLSAPAAAIYQQDLGLPLPPNFGAAGDVAKPAAHDLYRIANDAGLGRIPDDDLDAWRRYENYYLNCLRDVDRKIGTVLDAMDEAGAWSDTVVVFTSDHGEMSGAHGLRGKGNVIYRESASVPFAIIHPDIKSDADTPALASHVDIAPTLLRFAGVEVAVLAEQAPWLKGCDLTAALGSGASRTLGGAGREGALYQWDSRIYGSADAAEKAAEAFRHNGAARAWKLFNGPILDGLKNRHAMRGAFDGRWKFARYFRPREHNTPRDLAELRRLNDVELYDTAADPMERVNVADRPEAAADLLRMSNLTNRLMAREVGPAEVAELPGPSFLWTAWRTAAPFMIGSAARQMAASARSRAGRGTHSFSTRRTSMNRIFAIAAPAILCLAAVLPASAGDPRGNWMTENGRAKVAIVSCGAALCGSVVALKEPNDRETGKPRTDRNNPDAARRTRPMIGVQIVINMKPDATAEKWAGQVYNAEDGNTYAGSITLVNATTLRLQGCALGGLVCRNQTWTRTN